MVSRGFLCLDCFNYVSRCCTPRFANRLFPKLIKRWYSLWSDGILHFQAYVLPLVSSVKVFNYYIVYLRFNFNKISSPRRRLTCYDQEIDSSPNLNLDNWAISCKTVTRQLKFWFWQKTSIDDRTMWRVTFKNCKISTTNHEPETSTTFTSTNKIILSIMLLLVWCSSKYIEVGPLKFPFDY